MKRGACSDYRRVFTKLKSPRTRDASLWRWPFFFRERVKKRRSRQFFFFHFFFRTLSYRRSGEHLPLIAGVSLINRSKRGSCAPVKQPNQEAIDISIEWMRRGKEKRLRVTMASPFFFFSLLIRFKSDFLFLQFKDSQDLVVSSSLASAASSQADLNILGRHHVGGTQLLRGQPQTTQRHSSLVCMCLAQSQKLLRFSAA